MHAGALMLFESPEDEAGEGLVDRVYEAFCSCPPVAPFDRRPRTGLGPPSWETCQDIDMSYHVRRVTLPAPGTGVELMELVGYLYSALLDRTRPLWECYLIDGLANGGVAILYKLHHALADGITGARLLFGSLSESAEDAHIRPLWAEARRGPRRSRRKEPRRQGPNPLGLVRDGAATAAEAGRLTLGLVPRILRLRSGATALPFTAPRLESAQRRQSGARSFAIFDLPLPEVKRVAELAGGSTNDVVLSVCDDAMRRYLAETGQRPESPLVASMAVSTRARGDETPSNAAALTQVRLGSPEASPEDRLREVVSSTAAVKEKLRQTSSGVLQIQSLALLGASELREQLPMGRGTVPEAANMLVSNIPAGPPEPLYMGGARMTGIHATPIVPPAHSLNITLASYAGRMCFGVGAARNVIPDTQRIADLAVECFDELARDPEPATLA